MTLEEAKDFYFAYRGFSFHMDREEPARYNTFRMLGIGGDTLGKWDEELLEALFADFRSDLGRVWVKHGDILKIIGRGRCNARKYLKRLLAEMDKIRSSDLFGVTLMIENMAGRTESQRDGGVYVFSRYPDLAAEMTDVTGRLIDACRSGPETGVRFEEAVRSYTKACRKWIR